MALRSREDEALAYLDVCERIGTDDKLPLDLARYRPETVGKSDMAYAAYAFSTFNSKMRVHAAQAAAGWKADFREVVDRATSMRERKPPLNKEAWAPGTCMGCGRREHLNAMVLDLAGPEVKSKRWSESDPSEVRSTWKDFHGRYAKAFAHDPCAWGGARVMDMGTYALGVCCHRKAKLYFSLATQTLLHVYDAHHVHRDAEEEDQAEGYLYATKDEAAALVKNVDALVACLTDERRAVPKVATDTAFWERVDVARQRNSTHGISLEITQNAINAAEENMGRTLTSWRFDEDEEDAASDAEDEEEVTGQGNLRGFVEEEEEEEMGPPPKGQRVRKRRRSVVDEEEDEEGEEEEEQHEQPAAEQSARRLPSMVAVERFVAHQRRQDAVPARRETVTKLYALAARLSQELPDRAEDAAIASQAAMTISALMAELGKQ